MKIEKRQIVITAALFVMVAGFVLFQYIPMSRTIAQVKQVQQQQKQENKIAQMNSKRLPELQQQIEQLQEKVGDFDAKIPADRDFGSFLQNVSDLMNRYDLENQVVKPGNEKSFQKLNTIPITMECSGSLENIFKFLLSFENSQRLFSIEQFRLENKQYADNVKMFAQGNIFYRNTLNGNKFSR